MQTNVFYLRRICSALQQKYSWIILPLVLEKINRYKFYWICNNLSEKKVKWERANSFSKMGTNERFSQNCVRIISFYDSSLSHLTFFSDNLLQYSIVSKSIIFPKWLVLAQDISDTINSNARQKFHFKCSRFIFIVAAIKKII